MAETNKAFDVFKEGKRRASLKAMTESKVTRVLLICVYNQGSTLITHDTIHNAFSPYGKINRILIFDKLKVWKAFVEFSDLESAIEAKRNMNDVLLFKDGTRMNVYFSNREMIQFQNNNSGGKDYTVENSFEVQSAGDRSFDQPFNQSLIQPYLQAPPMITHSLSAGAKGYIAQFRQQHQQKQQQQQQNVNNFSIHSVHSERDSEARSNKSEASFTQDSIQSYQDYMAPPMITHSLSCGAQRSVSTTSRTNSQFNSPNLKTKWWMNRDEAEDDDDDEILEIINEHQQEIGADVTPKNPKKDLRKPSEDDKLEEAFESPFLSAFQNKDAGLFRSKTINTLSLTSKPFGDSQSKNQPWSQPQQNNQHLLMGNGPSLTHSTSLTHSSKQNLRDNGTYSPISLKIPMQNNRSNNNKNFASPQMGYQQFQNNQSNGFNPKFQQQQQTQQSQNAKKQADIMERINYLCSDRRTNQPSLIRAHQFNHQPERTFAPPEYSNGYENQNSESILDLIESEISQNRSNYQQYSNPMEMNKQQFPSDNFSPREPNMINGISPRQQHGTDAPYKDVTKKSQALYIKGLVNSDINVQMLNNIFSNFGNVISIVLVKDKKAALLEYENSDYASIAKECLNNLVFMGNPLSIFYSSYSVINPRDKLNQNDPGEEVLIGNPKNWRFQKNKPMQFNPPSQILHISNLAKEACSDILFQHFFGPFGTIEAIKFTSFENRNTCLLKMASVEESLLVVAYLNDAEIAGRNIYISFTRCKI